MAKNDFQYADGILTPAMWHDHHIDFARWLHPAMWHVALESWQWITTWQHPAVWQMALGRHAIELAKRLPYWNSTSGFDFDHIITIDMSFCISAKFYLNRTTLGRKKMSSCRFSRWQTSAILDFRCPIMGSSKSLCTTSYRSSIETIAPNCLVFKRLTLL